MSVSESDEPEEHDLDDLDATDAADQRIQDLADERAWVSTCLEAIASGLSESDCAGPVRLALDSLVITAAARCKRILRSDLRGAKG